MRQSMARMTSFRLLGLCHSLLYENGQRTKLIDNRDNQTIPFIPSDVTPWLTALRAYSICTSLPLGENVVSENEYLSAIADMYCRPVRWNCYMDYAEQKFA